VTRAGIYKSDVLRARAKLLARGIYPSIDSVRAELGTGSKSTIHRYIKEIRDEEGGGVRTQVRCQRDDPGFGRLFSCSLHEEADTRIAEAAEENRAQVAQLNETIAALRKEADGLRCRLENALSVFSKPPAARPEAERQNRA